MIISKRLVFEEGQFGKWIAHLLAGLLGGDFVVMYFRNYRQYTSEFEVVFGLAIIAYCTPVCWRTMKEAVNAGNQMEETRQ